MQNYIALEALSSLFSSGRSQFGQLKGLKSGHQVATLSVWIFRSGSTHNMFTELCLTLLSAFPYVCKYLFYTVKFPIER